MNKIKERLMKLPYVMAVDQDSDGIWVYLKNGFQFADNPQCHTAHEDNWFAIQTPMRKGNVIPCTCKSCVSDAKVESEKGIAAFNKALDAKPGQDRPHCKLSDKPDAPMLVGDKPEQSSSFASWAIFYASPIEGFTRKVLGYAGSRENAVLWASAPDLAAEVIRLKALNKELLAALELARYWANLNPKCPTNDVRELDAAIAKAKGL